MQIINYSQIINLFNLDEWDFSYLTVSEMLEVLNQPVKMSVNLIEKLHVEGFDFPSDTIFLIIVKHNQDFDYSHYAEFNQICKNYLPEFIYDEFWCNFKYAAVKAGLGQYAKNSLFYHPKFQFDTHLSVIICHNKIINLPQRNNANYNLLSQCINCTDCYNACPPKAIHNQNGHIWIDMIACDNFCHFGNHSTIPSIKWNWLKYDTTKEFTKEEIYNIHSFPQLIAAFGGDFEPSCQEITINRDKYTVVFPVCRECTSQPKCSKYNGNYPYDWNKIKFIPLKED